MFNGIIYNQGIITKIIKRPKGLNIFIKSNIKVSNKDMGLSIACDGVCLTLISYKSKIMEFYLSKETIIRSKFKRKGIQLIKSRIDRNNRFDIKLILKKLHNYGCRNLLIEGGDKLTNSLIKNKIFNKFYLYKSPKNLSKNFEYLKFSSQNILNQKYKTKINLNLNLRKDTITLYS